MQFTLMPLCQALLVPWLYRWGNWQERLSDFLKVTWWLSGRASLLCFVLCFVFGCPTAYGVPGTGIRSEAQFRAAVTAWSFTPLCWAGQGVKEPASWCCRNASDPIVWQWELQDSLVFKELKLFKKLIYCYILFLSSFSCLCIIHSSIQ